MMLSQRDEMIGVVLLVLLYTQYKIKSNLYFDFSHYFFI